MARGRPRRTADEICSCQGFDDPGFCYFDTVKKEGQVYYYPRFRHYDSRVKDHPIKDWGPLQDLTEYSRDARKVTVFSLKGGRTSTPSPIVIYNVSRLKQDERIANFVGICRSCFGHCIHIHDLACDRCNNTTIVWCPKCQRHWDFSAIVRPYEVYRSITNFEHELKNSGALILKLKDVNWFLKTSKRIEDPVRYFLSELCKFLENPSHDFIISHGNTSTKEADRISNLFDCDITYLLDKFGILNRLERKVSMRDKQIDVYNNPPRTLADPKELVTTKASG